MDKYFSAKYPFHGAYARESWTRIHKTNSESFDTIMWRQRDWTSCYWRHGCAPEIWFCRSDPSEVKIMWCNWPFDKLFLFIFPFIPQHSWLTAQSNCQILLGVDSDPGFCLGWQFFALRNFFRCIIFLRDYHSKFPWGLEMNCMETKFLS